MTSIDVAAQKFDTARAGEYERQSRIALAGYEACHDLAACVLAAAVGAQVSAHVLVAGAGGGASEIIRAAALEPQWRFTALDPSRPMLDLALARLEAAGLLQRTTVVHGMVDDLASDASFDAATLIGVLHHLRGDEAKHAILRAMADRLGPQAPLILACNHRSYASQPLLLAAWANRWRQQGAPPADVEAKLATILNGADPPPSEQAVANLLEDAGFEPPLRFFSSLFWGAWGDASHVWRSVVSAARLVRAMAYNNRWANHRLHAVCSRLSQTEFEAPRVGFFPSLRATLNHILVIDRFYVDAMEGGTLGPAAWANEEPCLTMASLETAQAEIDGRLIAVVRSVTDAGLEAIVHVNRDTRIQHERLDRLLLHLFQHQVHHRGQAHAMLSGTPQAPPQLDEFFSAGEAPLREAEFHALGFTEARVWSD